MNDTGYGVYSTCLSYEIKVQRVVSRKSMKSEERDQSWDLHVTTLSKNWYLSHRVACCTWWKSSLVRTLQDKIEWGCWGEEWNKAKEEKSCHLGL